jgi:DNA ligase-1
MLANNIEKYLGKLEGTYAVTQKLDGIRTTCMNGQMISRNNKVFEGMSELINELNKIPYQLDGELLLRNDDNLSSDELFKKTSGYIRKKVEHIGVEFHIFDIIDEQLTYKERRYILESIEYNDILKKVPVLEYIDNPSSEDMNRLNTRAKEMQIEGFMLNKLDGMYVNKRSKELLKVKQFDTATLRVIGYEEGTGRNLGRLGAILVESEDGLVTSKVGSGFSDEDREEIWAKQDLSFVEIKYFELSEDTKGNRSLRFPTYLGERLDKEEADIL